MALTLSRCVYCAVLLTACVKFWNLRFGGSSGSTPGLVWRISDDLRTLRNVTSESVDISSVEASVPGHWVSGTLPKTSRTAAASRSRRSALNFTIAVAEVSLDRYRRIREPGRRGRTRHRSRRLDGVCSACSVFKILVGHDRQVRIDGMRTYRYSGGVKCRRETTRADQRWSVVSTIATTAGTDRSCDVDATPTKAD